MRYNPEHKTRTRDRIVRNAARQLRAEGLSGSGVASVMKASGLTVGGFYKHFHSKDELVADAIAQGFAEFDDKANSILLDVPQEDRWKEMVRRYLSLEHCDHPEIGCPVAALAPEIARAEVSVRQRAADLIQERKDQLLQMMPGATATERERNFFILLSAMAGAISVARIHPEAADRQKILQEMQDHLLRSF
ncbi:TetR/AcrR family transcriptional regulator [Terriglobus tenax]|uniref:TetR/AcrR family transcriptional regulator n=1 Tax=Terriglobus tenax TaxID=1111115 RepID=UPI0021E042CD|nr:TetR/AcrR family transcriptional regulator [Terriglobus tenax]